MSIVPNTSMILIIERLVWRRSVRGCQIRFGQQRVREGDHPHSSSLSALNRRHDGFCRKFPVLLKEMY